MICQIHIAPVLVILFQSSTAEKTTEQQILQENSPIISRIIESRNPRYNHLSGSQNQQRHSITKNSGIYLNQNSFDDHSNLKSINSQTSNSKPDYVTMHFLNNDMLDVKDSLFPNFSIYRYPNFPFDQDFPPAPSISRSSTDPPPFNTEGSEVGDAAFIIPDDKSVPVPPLPPFEHPKKTYALMVNDGQVNLNEIRKDDGEFVFSFTSADGTRRKEIGKLETKPDGEAVLIIRGSYVFTSPEGQNFRVDYQADQNGYRVVSQEPLASTNPTSAGIPAPGGTPAYIPKQPTNKPTVVSQNVPQHVINSKLVRRGKHPLVKPTPSNLSGKHPVTMLSAIPTFSNQGNTIPNFHRPAISAIPVRSKPFGRRQTTNHPKIHLKFRDVKRYIIEDPSVVV